MVIEDSEVYTADLFIAKAPHKRVNSSQTNSLDAVEPGTDRAAISYEVITEHFARPWGYLAMLQAGGCFTCGTWMFDVHVRLKRCIPPWPIILSLPSVTPVPDSERGTEAEESESDRHDLNDLDNHRHPSAS
ncbi:hypothetical protein PGT21_023553 [Puccinia graminis f. sp. tritici]|uniref:Uncharacterized protein n=1 Tax=Puccinia graminis f. sp. tritici TaxID=56615 RepID=A0A5B0N1C3_PUCGR|nr:hypothetical protein PGT21_023553 [Puccinia graminis f. sp. tritici]